MQEQLCKISTETRLLLAELCQSGKTIELWACDLSENPMKDCKEWRWDAYAFALRQDKHWVQLSLVMPSEGKAELQTFSLQVSERTEP